uniref:Uncharacterized protein n=1 Tax=Anguilla anguilla TaxID=7936 RepID=A0A0E9PBM0_ANGAN
MNRVQLQV